MKSERHDKEYILEIRDLLKSNREGVRLPARLSGVALYGMLFAAFADKR
jgi:hypothetical protein